MPKKKLYYRTHNVERSYKEKLELFKPHFVEVEASYVKRYKNCLYLIAQLSKTEIFFLEYLLEIMDNENYVANNKATRESFNLFMKKLNLEQLKESTLHKCFSKFSKLNLITTYKGKRGLYQISPIFFHSDNPEVDRERLIRKNLEKMNEEPINKLRHNILKKKGSS